MQLVGTSTKVPGIRSGSGSGKKKERERENRRRQAGESLSGELLLNCLGERKGRKGRKGWHLLASLCCLCVCLYSIVHAIIIALALASASACSVTVTCFGSSSFFVK